MVRLLVLSLVYSSYIYMHKSILEMILLEKRKYMTIKESVCITVQE